MDLLFVQFRQRNRGDRIASTTVASYSLMQIALTYIMMITHNCINLYVESFGIFTHPKHDRSSVPFGSIYNVPGISSE